MDLGERVASAIRVQTDSVQPPLPDLAVIRASVRRQKRRRGAIAVGCAFAAVVAAVVAGASGIGGDRTAGIEPIAPPSASPSASTASERIDTDSWTRYTSDRYGIELGHPPDWTTVPATRSWRAGADMADALSPAHEAFRSPAGDVRVSVWSMPLDSARTTECVDTSDRGCVESIEYLQAWVEAYCRESKNTPCTGIADRAVELCLEKRDCHPGLLVRFQDDVQAFFSGGIYDADAMTVVAVWRGEQDPSVARYGGAQRLLEAYLSTMQVWPAPTPRG
jgi:hypothetical protein